MVDDIEPRYRLVNSGGTVVGSLYAEADGTLKLQEGTSGSDNELAFGTDGSLSVESATIDGKTGDGTPDTSTDASSTGFGTWRTPSSDRPVTVLLQASVETDGTTSARINLLVDEGGGTSADYAIEVAFADDGLGSGGVGRGSPEWTLPPGASYQIQNLTDPNNNNAISNWQEFER